MSLHVAEEEEPMLPLTLSPKSILLQTLQNDPCPAASSEGAHASCAAGIAAARNLLGNGPSAPVGGLVSGLIGFRV